MAIEEEFAGRGAEDIKREEQLSEERAFYASVIISMARVYDVLLVMLAESNPERASQLRAAHARGVLYSPPPSFVKDTEE